jgi:hypothetical protein
MEGLPGSCLMGQILCWCEIRVGMRQRHGGLKVPLEKHVGIVDQFEKFCRFRCGESCVSVVHVRVIQSHHLPVSNLLFSLACT